jgi:hypothetical protein
LVFHLEGDDMLRIESPLPPEIEEIVTETVDVGFTVP